MIWFISFQVQGISTSKLTTASQINGVKIGFPIHYAEVSESLSCDIHKNLKFRDINVKYETKKVLEENRLTTFFNCYEGKCFLIVSKNL